jgi:hypothetical protein
MVAEVTAESAIPGRLVAGGRIAAVAAPVLLVVLCSWRIFALNDGQFTFTLDDPYIHLALAETLKATGTFGLEPGVVAAPSSSFLWPFLLVAIVDLPRPELAIVVFNTACIAAVSLLVFEQSRRLLYEAGPPATAAALAIALAVTMLLDLPGLALGGMEHPLQLVMTGMAAFGLVRFLDGGRIPWWLAVGAALGPLVRYENLAILACVTAILAAHRRFGPAAAIAAVPLLPLVGFGWWLMGHGMPPVPTSILAKSGADSPAALVQSVLDHCRDVLHFAPWVDMAFLWTLAILLLNRNTAAPSRRMLTLAMLAVLGFHICFTGRGNHNRYLAEAGLWAGVLLMAVHRRLPTRPPASLRLLMLGLGGALGLLLLFRTELSALAAIPHEANNIYNQQFQMHRFVTGWWRRPVAVNDLGLVSWRNEAPVLDLWGLVSPQMYRIRFTRSRQGLAKAVADRDIDLVMIYDSWFRDFVPCTWIAVAKLKITARNYALGSPEVTFYATHGEAAASILADLEAFAPMLAPGAALSLLADGTPQGCGLPPEVVKAGARSRYPVALRTLPRRLP